ncbi:hypothetical protein D3C84_1104330 [compost metagenome]
MNTRQPAALKYFTVAWPIPRLAPVSSKVFCPFMIDSVLFGCRKAMVVDWIMAQIFQKQNMMHHIFNDALMSPHP